MGSIIYQLVQDFFPQYVPHYKNMGKHRPSHSRKGTIESAQLLRPLPATGRQMIYMYAYNILQPYHHINIII